MLLLTAEQVEQARLYLLDIVLSDSVPSSPLFAIIAESAKVKLKRRQAFVYVHAYNVMLSHLNATASKAA